MTASTLEVETSLTRNIQADADVRVRGTPDRPMLLGHVTVNSGQIEFFGNKYSINRGEIKFDNPSKIEPNINMDLSTQVRGITVDISFSGSLEQTELLLSFRSAAAAFRHRRAAGGGPDSRRRRSPGLSASRH